MSRRPNVVVRKVGDVRLPVVSRDTRHRDAFEAELLGQEVAESSTASREVRAWKERLDAAEAHIGEAGTRDETLDARREPLRSGRGLDRGQAAERAAEGRRHRLADHRHAPDGFHGQVDGARAAHRVGDVEAVDPQRPFALLRTVHGQVAIGRTHDRRQARQGFERARMWCGDANDLNRPQRGAQPIGSRSRLGQQRPVHLGDLGRFGEKEHDPPRPADRHPRDLEAVQRGLNLVIRLDARRARTCRCLASAHRRRRRRRGSPRFELQAMAVRSDRPPPRAALVRRPAHTRGMPPRSVPPARGLACPHGQRSHLRMPARRRPLQPHGQTAAGGVRWRPCH